MAKLDIITIWKITIFRKNLCHNRKKGFCFFFLFLSFPIFFILFMEIQYFALACFVSQIARTLCELSEYIIILCILSKHKHKREYFYNSSFCLLTLIFIFKPSLNSWFEWNIWDHLGPYGSIWIHLSSSGSIRIHLGPSGSIRVNLGSFRFILIHFGPFWFILYQIWIFLCIRYGKERRNYEMFCETRTYMYVSHIVVVFKKVRAKLHSFFNVVLQLSAVA